MWRFIIFIVVALYLFYFWIAPTNEKPKKVKKKIFDEILKKQ